MSHGAPSAALEDDAYTRALGAWARARPRPRAVVVLSAHAEAPGPVRVNAAPYPSLVYDFYGFAQELYDLRYPAPGAPDLAREIDGAPGRRRPGSRPRRGARLGSRRLGAAAPALPRRGRAVVELSLPVPRTPALLLATGAALRPLRDEGVLLVGSGGIVHNLRRLGPDDGGSPLPWAAAFDTWVKERLLALDRESLGGYRTLAPHAELAVPTSEHFDPLFFVLGALDPRDRVESVYEGFRFGTLSLRSFALAAP